MGARRRRVFFPDRRAHTTGNPGGDVVYLSHADRDQSFDLMEYHGLVGELDQRFGPAQRQRPETRAVAADQYQRFGLGHFRAGIKRRGRAPSLSGRRHGGLLRRTVKRCPGQSPWRSRLPRRALRTPGGRVKAFRVRRPSGGKSRFGRPDCPGARARARRFHYVPDDCGCDDDDDFRRFSHYCTRRRLTVVCRVARTTRDRRRNAANVNADGRYHEHDTTSAYRPDDDDDYAPPRITPRRTARGRVGRDRAAGRPRTRGGTPSRDDRSTLGAAPQHPVVLGVHGTPGAPGKM